MILNSFFESFERLGISPEPQKAKSFQKNNQKHKIASKEENIVYL
jgi:hypothetical protein